MIKSSRNVLPLCSVMSQAQHEYGLFLCEQVRLHVFQCPLSARCVQIGCVLSPTQPEPFDPPLSPLPLPRGEDVVGGQWGGWVREKNTDTHPDRRKNKRGTTEHSTALKFK